MPRLRETRQKDGGQRRNLIRIGPDMLTVPQLARESGFYAIHFLKCVLAGVDPDKVAVNSSMEQIAENPNKMDIPMPSRMQAVQVLLDRGYGKALDSDTLRNQEKLVAENLVELSNEDLNRLISRDA